MSLEKGRDEDHERTMQQLRLALIECYVSILHGLNEVEEEGQGFQQAQVQASNTFIEPHARSIHEYLESLLDQNFNFHEEMLSNMFELYIDLVTIFVTENHLPDSRTGNA
jgi:predicted Ser/Thr protein kinase